MKTDKKEIRECVEKGRDLCVEWRDRGSDAMEVARICERVRASMKRRAAELQGRQFRERQAAYALSLLGSLVSEQQGVVVSEQQGVVESEQEGTADVHSQPTVNLLTIREATENASDSVSSEVFVNPSALIVSPTDEMKNDVVKRVEVPQDLSDEAFGMVLGSLGDFWALPPAWLPTVELTPFSQLPFDEMKAATWVFNGIKGYFPEFMETSVVEASCGLEIPPVFEETWIPYPKLNAPVKPKPQPKPKSKKRIHLPENLRILEDLPGVLHAWRFRGRLFLMADVSYVEQIKKYFPELDMRPCAPPSFGRQKMYSRWIEPIVEGKQMDCTLAREAKQLEKNFRAKLEQQLAWDSSLRDELEVEWSDIYGRFQCFDWDEQCKLIDEADKYPAHNYSSSPGYVGHRYRDDLGLDRDREPHSNTPSPFGAGSLQGEEVVELRRV